MAGRNGAGVGIALGEREAVAVLLDRRGSISVRASHGLAEEGADPRGEMARLFAELRERLEGKGVGSTEGARVHLTFLPPLADVRVVELPPLRRGEVQGILTRDVGRHFLGPRRPRGVGIRFPDRGARSSSRGARTLPVLAAAVPLALLEGARGALEGVGWETASLGAAHGAWLATRNALRASQVTAVVAVLGESAHLLRLEGNDPVKVRQLPAGEGAVVLEGLGAGPGRVLLLGGSDAAGDDLQRALTRGGWEVVKDPDGWSGADESAAARAGVGELELLPPSLMAERRERTRRRALGLTGAGLVLLLGAAAANLWGVHRELAAVQAQRAGIRAEVAPLLLARDSLDALTGRVESVEALSRTAPHWTRSLVDLSVLLPTDTYLTGLFASGDTLELEAAGARAGAAIQALRESGLFEEVRLQGLVERELAEGETVVERFRLWARLPAPEGGTRP